MAQVPETLPTTTTPSGSPGSGSTSGSGSGVGTPSTSSHDSNGPAPPQAVDEHSRPPSPSLPKSSSPGSSDAIPTTSNHAAPTSSSDAAPAPAPISAPAPAPVSLNRGPYPTDNLVFRASTLEPELPPISEGMPPFAEDDLPMLPELRDNFYIVPDKVPHPFPSAAPKDHNAKSQKSDKERPYKVGKGMTRRSRVGQTIIWDRHKTVEEKLGEVNMLLSKMPGGEEDWDAFPPRTPPEVDDLFGRLTLQHKFSRKERGAMSYADLLRNYEELVTQVPTYERQMFKVMSVGLSRMATKLGPMRTKEVFEIMDGTASELRWTRVAVSRIIDATDILATFGLGERAYELSMRRDKLPSTVGRFTREHFALLIALLKTHPDKVYKPMGALPSGRLRIPMVLFELLGGDERTIKDDGGLRPMTIADVAGVLEVPSLPPDNSYLCPTRGKAIPVVRPLRPDDITIVLKAAKLQPETRRLKPSPLQDLISWRVLDLAETMYDR